MFVSASTIPVPALLPQQGSRTHTVPTARPGLTAGQRELFAHWGDDEFDFDVEPNLVVA